MNMKNTTIGLLSGLLFLACSKKETNEPAANPTPAQFKVNLAFSDTLPRLGNLGQPVSVPPENAAQHPNMQLASAHYIELAPSANTQLGQGEIIYEGKETNAGGNAAIDFREAKLVGNGEQFLSVNLSDVTPGTYTWVRVSLSYQLYDIAFRLNDGQFFNNDDFTGRFASFVGFNNYIANHTVKDSNIVVNENKAQGYWAFETVVSYNNTNYGSVNQGDGAGVTVVNPISNTSPVPAGSCVVTGQLAEPLVITGNETNDMTLVLAFSINNSFEWREVVADGKYEPGAGEQVVDMGLRGLHPFVKE